MIYGIGPCACIGPIGDCPCIRKSKGLKVDIVRSHISDEVWNCLSDEDKNLMNKLCSKAFWSYFQRKNNDVK